MKAKGVLRSRRPPRRAAAAPDQVSEGWISLDDEPSPPPPGVEDEYERDKGGRLVYQPSGCVGRGRPRVLGVCSACARVCASMYALCEGLGSSARCRRLTL